MTGGDVIKLVGETLFGIILGMALSVPVHEMGHLVGGMITGYKFVAFELLGTELVRDNNGCRIRRKENAPIGQCIMESDRMDRAPALLILGGIAANMLMGSIIATAGLMAQTHEIMAFTVGIGGMNIAIGLLNITSTVPTSDAATFAEAYRLAGGIELYNRLMCIYSELERGKDHSQVSEKYLVSNVWVADRKRELNDKEYYMSTLAAELMYYRYLRVLFVYGSENAARMEKEVNIMRKFAGALKLLGHELNDPYAGREEAFDV